MIRVVRVRLCAPVLLALVVVIGGAASPGRAHAQPPTAPPSPGPAPAPAPSPGPASDVSPSPTSPPAPCTARVDGHVVDAVTHEPIPGATVFVDGAVVVDTDAAGRFVLTGRCPGPALIEVERADYVRGSRTLTLPAQGSLELELTAFESEVIVVEERAPRAEDMRATAVIEGAALARTRGAGLAGALAEVPGVAQLGSGSGMAKPIIRGQYGRRLLMLVDGIRHRGQDWGLDHAPEIDPFIADRLTVVRGASGVRYGPDAIGGAVLIDPPPLLREPGLVAELHLIGSTNARGGSTAARVQGAPASVRGLAWQLEGSVKRQGGAATPTYALDNTGLFDGSIGATIGYRHDDAEYMLSYRRYQAKLGVCSCLRLESIDDFNAQLERDRPVDADLYTTGFEIDRAYQAVAHDLALARARWELTHLGALTATYALQYDHRREYDVVRSAVTGPQFDFRLLTNEVELRLEHNQVHLSDHLHLRGEVGVVGTSQIHHYAGLPLVPDHQALGVGAYAIERLIAHDVEVEAGVRYDGLARTASIERQDFLRLVRSGQLTADACGAADADPVECAARYHTLSASVGALVRVTEPWALKLDLSTASRPPNPDELYLNGTSPTFPVVGLGKPDLGPETTYGGSLTSTIRTDHVTAEASAYANYIADYIYFAPAIDADGDPIYDVLIRGTFPRFTTRAVDALFYGVDGGVAVTPAPWLELGAQVSAVRARNTRDDSYLVFVPPDRARGHVTYRPPAFAGLTDLALTVTGEVVRRQGRFDPQADLAPPPPGFFLLGAEASARTRVSGHPLTIALAGANLLDARYREYTSLTRYFVDQPGWQLLLRLGVTFGKDS